MNKHTWRLGQVLIILLALFIGVCFALGSVSAVGTYPAVDPNMVLYYHFNNQSAYGENNTFVYDFSGEGNNGTANNTQFQTGTGILGDGSFDFNGVNSSLFFTNSIYAYDKTYCFWINFSSVLFPSQQTILSNNGNYPKLSLLNSRLLIYQSANNYRYISLNLLPNVWYHVCVAYINNSDFSYGSVNGDVKDYGFTNVGSSTSGSFNKISGQSGSILNASIDEFIIYNYTLNSSSIREVYNTYVPCSVFSDNMNIFSDTFLCRDNYFTNYSLSNYIRITGDDIIFDCNNSNIFGNNSNIFFNGNAYSNLTIKNCNIFNYSNPIKGFNNFSKIINNTIVNSSLGVQFNYNVSDILIQGNRFINVIYSIESNGKDISTLHVLDNYFYNSNIFDMWGRVNDKIIFSGNIQNYSITSKKNMFFYSFTNSLFSNNIFYDLSVYRNHFNGNVTNSVFRNNIFNGSYNQSIIFSGAGEHYLLFISSYGNNVSVLDNYFSRSSIFLAFVNNSANINVLNNRGFSSYGNKDSWNNAVVIYNSVNVNFNNNTFVNCGCNCFMSTNNNNLSFVNNFGSINLTDNILNRVNCMYEPNSGIDLNELYKNWMSDDSENCIDGNLTNNIGFHNNKNIFISGNVFSGIDVWLKDQGTVNLTSDINLSNSQVWLFSYKSPTYLVDKTNLYIDKNTNILTNTANFSDYQVPVTYNNIMGQGFCGSRYALTQFIVSKDYYWFNNSNITSSSYIPINPSVSTVFNQSSALVYNTNGSLLCGGLVTGDCNITLSPNNASYVLDVYNWTLGYSRPNDPLFNGTFINNTLADTVTIKIYGIHTLRNAFFSNGSRITPTQLTVAPGNYGYVY